MLYEVPGEQGVVLWQTLRDVLLWAQTPPAQRAQLFAPGAYEGRLAAQLVAEMDGAVEHSVQTLAQLLADPVGISPEAVAVACRQIAQWAEANGWLATALTFAQNAALACPADPGSAFTVATLARCRADHARAEVWYRRAIGLARRSRDWRLYSQAFRGLGNLYVRRGNFPAARRLHMRALRGARRGGMRQEQAAALHDLFGIAVETGSHASAEQYAQQAFQAYGPRSRHLPALAHDVAYFYLSQGEFARALPVFQAVLPLVRTPLERLYVLADVARAAAGLGDGETARAAAEEVRCMCEENVELAEGAGQALLEVARGYCSLHEWDAAEAVAQQALALAEQRHEAKVRFAAEALLDAVQTSRVAAVAGARPAPPTVEQGGLADELVTTLRAMAAEAS